MSKIPRPWSINSCDIILDNINWFDFMNNSVPTSSLIELNDDKSFNFINTSSDTYQSNCICISKQFYYGAKYNPLKIKVEVTNTDNNKEILDDTLLYQKLSSYFGKGYRKTVCVPNEDEEKILLIKRSKIRKFIDKAYEKLQLMVLPSGLLYDEKTTFKETTEKLNSRKAFERVFKQSGFIYKNLNYSYFEKINQYNFSIKITTGVSSGSNKSMSSFIEFAGYNFKIYMCTLERNVCTQKDLENSMNDLKFIIGYWEDVLIESLYFAYGITPDWYIHSLEYGMNFNFTNINAGIDLPYFDYSKTT